MSWRDLITYPQCLSTQTISTLDALETFLPVPDSGDRFVDLSLWLKDATKEGMLSSTEVRTIRSDIGPHM